MHTNTNQPSGTRAVAARRSPVRLALAGVVTLTTVAVLAPAPAQARVETPQDTGGRAASAQVSPTRVAGLSGIHVDGGWLLR
jgi:hypothetical protein